MKDKELLKPIFCNALILNQLVNSALKQYPQIIIDDKTADKGIKEAIKLNTDSKFPVHIMAVINLLYNFILLTKELILDSDVLTKKISDKFKNLSFDIKEGSQSKGNYFVAIRHALAHGTFDFQNDAFIFNSKNPKKPDDYITFSIKPMDIQPIIVTIANLVLHKLQ